jgi:hypothetical protein
MLKFLSTEEQIRNHQNSWLQFELFFFGLLVYQSVKSDLIYDME